MIKMVVSNRCQCRLGHHVVVKCATCSVHCFHAEIAFIGRRYNEAAWNVLIGMSAVDTEPT